MNEQGRTEGTAESADFGYFVVTQCASIYTIRGGTYISPPCLCFFFLHVLVR